MEAECGTLLREFFAQRRAAHKARQAALNPASSATAADDDEAIPVADVILNVDDHIPVGVATEIDPAPPDDTSGNPPDQRGATR